VRAESFRDYFVQFGSVADVVIMYDNTTKRSRGFGFITFDAGRISWLPLPAGVDSPSSGCRYGGIPTSCLVAASMRRTLHALWV
jgi:hypothetical protein